MAKFFLLVAALYLASLATGAAAYLNPRQGNSVCAKWCADKFTNPGSSCTSLAAKGTGPCYECGPGGNPYGKVLCGKVCRSVQTDPYNCGACDIKCTGGKTCSNGKCVCPYGTKECNGECKKAEYFLTDPYNCGDCNIKCTGGKTCSNGKCVCPYGTKECNGECKKAEHFLTDPYNCGDCNVKCYGGQKCQNGKCVH